MELQSMICPKCGGQLFFESNQDICFCSHCGTQVFKNDENKKSFTYRTVDEARIKESEVKRDIALKTFEFKERKEKRSIKSSLIIIGVTWGLVAALWGIIILFASKDEKEYEVTLKEMTEQGLISAGSHYDYRDKNYKSAMAMLESAGFTNIETIELNDTSVNDGVIDTIAIGGNSDFKREDFFKPDVKIIITYH